MVVNLRSLQLKVAASTGIDDWYYVNSHDCETIDYGKGEVRGGGGGGYGSFCNVKLKASRALGSHLDSSTRKEV